MDPRLDTPDSVSFYHTWISLEGIDKNSNGVRDDVEIEIVNYTSDIYLIKVYFEWARNISKFIDGSSKNVNFSILQNLEITTQLNDCSIFIKRSIKFNSNKYFWLPEIVKNSILRDYVYHFNSKDAGRNLPPGGYMFSKLKIEDSCTQFFEDESIFQEYIKNYYLNK
ncbi:MAG: hypothetical protein Fur0010_23560 [Bdellovibrio sp.]